MRVHTCKTIAKKAEAEGSQVRDQPEQPWSLNKTTGRSLPYSVLRTKAVCATH